MQINGKRSLVLLLLLLAAGTAFGQQAILKGSVRSNGEAVSGAHVFVEGADHPVLTDYDGHFELPGLDSGLHRVVVKYLGNDSVIVPFSIKQGEILNLPVITLKQDGKLMSEVKVTGKMRQGSDLKAMNMTKTSDKVITVVSAESIAKMPDKNAADAMQRVGGAAVQKSKGEGNVVSLRGTPTDWTATLINGNRLPTANESDASRIFDFQLFPSSLIEYIVVTKTVTPDIEGDNIGGAINFLTRSSVTEQTLQVDLSGGYSMLAKKPAFELNLLAGNISKNKKFTYLINGSYYARAYAADAPVLAYGTNLNHSIARLELKKYTGQRYTEGINTAAEYKPNEHFKIGVKFLQGYLKDDKSQQKTMYNWSDGSGMRIRLQNIRGLLINEMYGGELNTEWKPDNRWKFEVKLASYYNKFHYGPFPYAGNDPRNGYTTVEFISPLLQYTDKINTNFLGGKYDPNNTKDPNPYPYKLLDIDNPYGSGGDHFNNIQPKYEQLGFPGQGVSTGDYYLSGGFADQNTTWEQDPIVGQVSGTYQVSDKLTLSAGGKYRIKQGARELGYYEWRIAPGVGKIPLTSFATTEMDPHNEYLKEWGSPYSRTFMPFLTQNELSGFTEKYGSLLSGKPMDTSNNNYRYWIGNKYSYQENVGAGYVMANAKVGAHLSFVGGLRIENTQLTERGDTLTDDPVATIGVRADDRTIKRSYTALLPALNALYSINNSNNLRAAISRTFHRPNFQETKPGSAIYERENFLIIQGNPDLKPTYSLNLDLMYEHYWGANGMFSVGGYYKRVTNHIFASSQADQTAFNDGMLLTTFMNANKSFVVGVEAMIDRKFNFLPGFLGGFGINANVTYSYSEMQVPGKPFKQAMTEQAPLLYNVALYYERKKITTRLGLNYRGAFTTDVNMAANPDETANGALLHLNTDYDLFMGSIYSLDFQFGYQLTKHFSTYLELNNLTDAPYRTYIGRPERPIRTEYYRQKGMVGVKFQL